jgi:hypothetical protein
MKSVILEKIVSAEEKITSVLKDYKDPWNLPESSIWIENKFHDMILIKKSGDVYDLLADSSTVTAIKHAPFFTIVTTGWAAPMDDSDVAPSQHKKRRRVRLSIGASVTGVASVMRFQDNPDEIVADENKAKGSLADAVWDLLKEKLRAENENN